MKRWAGFIILQSINLSNPGSDNHGTILHRNFAPPFLMLNRKPRKKWVYCRNKKEKIYL
jgi:hypothetical protein